MSAAQSALSEFLEEQLGVAESLPDDEDLFERFGVAGDDAFDFIDRFATQFEIEGSNYRWYFHHGEEGFNLGGMLFPPPYMRVERLPITPAILVEAIQTRQWPLDYPEHREPGVRWDLWLNTLIALLSLIALAFWIVSRFLS